MVWCAPCRALALIIEAVAERYAGNAQVVKLDVDRNPSVVEKFRIEAIPTLIVFQDGEEKERVIGAVSQDAIDAHLGSAMN
jgi:thioredoxin 1